VKIIYVILIFNQCVFGQEKIGCSDDTDCYGTDRCLFANHHPIGECASWRPPLDEVTRIEIQTGVGPTFLKGAQGHPCQFNSDCLPNYQCFKLVYSFDGQCIRVP